MRFEKRIGIIGCGHMGRAIVRGLLRNRVWRTNQIFVYDALRSRRESVSRRFRVRATKSNFDLVRRAQVILLAVKPQDLGCVAEEVRTALHSGQTLISILAGTPIQKVRRFFGNPAAVVRAMPNLGAEVGEAITALTGGNPRALRLAETIFSGCGKVIRLPEKHFDVVTAVSGSGPAYFFLMMELLAQAARQRGLSAKAAELLAVQTAVGAGRLAQSSSVSPEKLRKMVTSKRGTTEAALEFLSKNKFPKIFSCAIGQAVKRARELSQS